MLPTVKLRVQQEVNIYQFEVNNIYCQLKELMGFNSLKILNHTPDTWIAPGHTFDTWMAPGHTL